MCYQPREHLTVDEQLMPCKNRCPFIQYMANKPDKFGIKFWLLCEVDSKYVLNGIPYLGKEVTKPTSIQLGHHIVLQLFTPYTNLGYNITCDNFFTSYGLAKELLNLQSSLVGTLRLNRRELPNNFTEIEKNLSLYESKFLKDESGISITIYKGKVKKSVVVMSTSHRSHNLIPEHPKRLPRVIDFYNHTKFGVDSCDQMTRMYTTRFGSRRWPVQVFCNILDFCGINSWILFRKCTGINISRKKFLLDLGLEMCAPLRVHRTTIEKKSISPAFPEKNRKRRQCQISFHQNKSFDECTQCKRVCCGQCTARRETIVWCKNCS